MTYYLIMFQVDPVPQGAPGPIKLKILRKDYEVAATDQNATIICDKGKFVVQDKRVFSIEGDNVAFIVADVIKVKQE